MGGGICAPWTVYGITNWLDMSRYLLGNTIWLAYIQTKEKLDHKNHKHTHINTHTNKQTPLMHKIGCEITNIYLGRERIKNTHSHFIRKYNTGCKNKINKNMYTKRKRERFSDYID